MRIRIELTGTTPLLMHSDRLSDPSNKVTIAIKELTAKGKNKTTRDDDEISKLEWFGSAYVDEKNEIVIPSMNIIRCLRDAAGITRKGKDIARFVSPYELNIPLIIGGTRKLDELWNNPAHIDRRMVKPQRGRVKRTRPIFPKWGLTAHFELLDSVLNFDALKNICVVAGLSTGLGDARILGYGRFEAKVAEVK